MEKPEGYFLGYFSKTHGIAGGILLRSDVLLPEDIEETEFVFVNFDQILVPFFVSAIEVKNDETAVLFLRDVAGDDLKELIGREVYLEDGYSVEKTNDPLAGYHIVDMNSDFSGEIEGLEDIPAISSVRGTQALPKQPSPST